MKKLCLLGFLILFISSADAEEINQRWVVSGDVAVVSDYLPKGINLARGAGPLVQAGVRFQHDSGFFAGVFGSTVNFGTADIEFNPHVGYTQTINDVTLQTAIIRTVYPGVDSNLSFDFTAFQNTAWWKRENYTLMLDLNYAFDFFADTGEMLYSTLKAFVPITDKLMAEGSISYLMLNDSTGFGTPEFANINYGVTYKIKDDLTFLLNATNTSLERGTNPNDNEPQIVVGIRKSF